MVRVITAVLIGPTGRLGPPPGGRPPVVAAFTAGILGGSHAQKRGHPPKGGGMSARPLPMPINPALLKHADQRRQHLENRIADQITRFAGSMLFVYLHIIWFAVWILSGVEHYPYGLLTMIVSLEAIFLSTFVMISQNRADEKRQVLADHQWQTVQEEDQQNQELLGLSNQILELTKAIHAIDTARSPTGRDGT
jgi:low affinity Fe/Cu permease